MDGFGLVLCGGGGKGAYQIGVWQALKELGYTKHISAVSGTSVGALNAALYVSKSVDEAAEIWKSIKSKDLMDYVELVPKLTGMIEKIYRDGISAFGFPKEGLFSRKGLRDIIISNNICRDVMNSRIPVYACYKHGTGTVYSDIIYSDMRRCRSEEEVIEVLFASSAIPVVFRTGNSDGSYSVDGGFIGDNTPVKPLYDLGIRKFIVVGLNPEASFTELSYYYDAEFICIKPTENIYLGASGKKFIDDGLIDFDGKNAAVRIQLGYHEGMFQLRKLLSMNSTSNNCLPSDGIRQIINDCSFNLINEKSRIYTENIPSYKLKNALDTYAYTGAGKNILAMFDDSWGDSGKYGFLITEDSVILPDAEIYFRDITAIEAKTFLYDYYNGSLNIYYGAGRKHTFSGSNCNKNAMKKMLEEIKKLC